MKTNQKAIRQISAIWLLQSMINDIYDDFCEDQKIKPTKVRQALHNIKVNQANLVKVFQVDLDKGSDQDKAHFSEDFEYLQKQVLNFIEK